MSTINGKKRLAEPSPNITYRSTKNFIKRMKINECTVFTAHFIYNYIQKDLQ